MPPLDTVSETAFEQVVVTTPDGQQVLVRRWSATGNFEADWRATDAPREVWRPVDRTDWRVEVQS